MAQSHWTTAGRVVALLTLAAIGAGSWWWLREQRETVPTETVARHPDSWFKSLDVTRHDESGRPELRLTAQYAEHYEDEPWILLRKFEARGLEGGPDWQLNAARGRMSDDGETLEAWGNVVLRRAGDAALELATEHLVINTETEIAESDERVTIRQGSGVVQGTGLHASLADDYLELQSNVEARYGH